MTMQTITDLAQRVAALESIVTRRIGIIEEDGRDLTNMKFDVRLVDGDGDSQKVIRGVRLLYMRQSTRLTTWMIPEEGETVVLERLGTGWVIVGSYAHDLANRTRLKPPLGADWHNRYSIPFEAQTNYGGIQLASAEQSPLSGVTIGSDAMLYLGKTSSGSGEDDTDVLAAILTARHYTHLQGYDMSVRPTGVVFAQLSIDSADENANTIDADNSILGEVLIIGDIDKDDGVLESEVISGESVSSGGTPSHRHNIPAHSHKLPVRVTRTVTIIEEKP